MFYWFMKGTEKLRFEAREVSPTRFELTVTGCDHRERIEVFTTAEGLHRRQVALELELEADGWAGPHGRHV